MKREMSSSVASLPANRLVELLSRFHDELARKHRDARRARSGNVEVPGLLDWSRDFLSKHFARPPAGMHVSLARELAAMVKRRGSQLNVLAPRGAAKSTLGTLAYPLWVSIHQLEPYVWIVSDTWHQAAAHLENLKAELIDNPRIAEAYPNVAGRGRVWRRNRIVLRNGVTIEAYGTGQRIRGRRHRQFRPTLILCDDLENDGHMFSARQREQSWDWFHGTLLKAGHPETNVVNLATALHREALAVRLDRLVGWRSRRYQSIVTWPRNMSLWEQWESIYTNLERARPAEEAREFYRRHQREMNDEAVVLWPEVEDLYTLMRMRTESGRATFAREKQNAPRPPELCEWPESYFDETVWFERWPDHLRAKSLALDPSKGVDARRGDYSAFVMMGVDRQGTLYVEADMARRPTPQIVADGVALYERFRPDAFGIESNQFQDLLAGEFASEFRRQGRLDIRPWELENRVNKLVRIRRLGPYLAARRIRFKSDSASTRLLVDQLKDFPLADHDDGPDAAEMALRMIGELLADPMPSDGLGSRIPVDSM